ncbi:HAD-IA family hydrolase [Microbacterium murale]|uniref:Sugar-phosphatase n=1 Tax=Microbacterium murale TaxID=1081040 RepID=A0ABU0P955_9MICO|nr:HAD-IA family hydrolase [Microbacterium murale]MDQ0643877.1 sugar-phosphatase [Microbacterium murale]
MTQMLFPVDGVLFDCDGVLVDSLEPAAVAWDAWSSRYAPGYDFRTQMEHGVRAADVIATLVDPEILAEAITALDQAEVTSAFATAGIPGAVDLTRSLPADRWAVVTSATRALARRRLASAHHPEPRFLITADDVTNGKPDPEPYRRGAEALGLDPAACAVLEDAPAGVRAARTAGVRWVIGVGDHLEGTPVDAHVSDLRAVAYQNGALTVLTVDGALASAQTSH